MSNIKKFDFSTLNKEAAKESTKAFKNGLSSLGFQNKIMQYQASLHRKESSLTKKVESLQKRFDKAKSNEAVIRGFGKVPAAMYDELVKGFNSIADGKAIIYLIHSKVEKMEKDLEKCQSDEQSDIVKRYYSVSFLEPLKIAKQVESFLLDRDLVEASTGLEEAEVISSDLLPAENKQKEVEELVK